MNDLKALESLGLTMPTPSYWVGMILFGIIGYIAFQHGKKKPAPITKWVGLALMLFPYAVSETMEMYLVGGTLCAGLYLYRGE